MTASKDYATAQMWARNISGDQAWQDHVTTLDESVLRHLAAYLKVQQRTLTSRRHFVEVMLELGEDHACNCDKRWTTSDLPHGDGCDLLKACTCERLWTTPSGHVLDHAPDCELRRGWPPPPRSTGTVQAVNGDEYE